MKCIILTDEQAEALARVATHAAEADIGKNQLSDDFYVALRMLVLPRKDDASDRNSTLALIAEIDARVSAIERRISDMDHTVSHLDASGVP